MAFRGTIRLDVISPDSGTRLEAFLEAQAHLVQRYLIYYEISEVEEKPHYQGLVECADEKKFQALKTQWSLKMKDWKKGQKSMAKVEKDTYAVYITKDKDLRFVKGFTEAEVRALEDRWVEREDRSNGDTKEPPFVRAYNWIKENHYITETSGGYSICAALIQYYQDICKCEPSTHQLKAMTVSIYTTLRRERAERQGTLGDYKEFLLRRARQILGSEGEFFD